MAAAVIKARQAQLQQQVSMKGGSTPDVDMKEHDVTKPDGTWSESRMYLYGMVSSHKFEAFCGMVILFNMLLVILETDASVDEGDPDRWMEIISYMLLSFYTAELGVKLYIFRFAFFLEPWNVLDLCIVGVDLILLVMGFIIANMPSVSVLRVFRLVRLARAFKAAKQFNELHALIRSFGFAMKAIFWGILMIIMILTIWSILAVQLLHPINKRLIERDPLLYEGCQRCPSAFSSVFESSLTFFQHVVAGDSWGNVSLPIIREEPWTCIFFLMVLVTVNLTMLNLILAVIVEAGAKATEEDMHEKAVQAQKKIKHAESRLIELCTTLDVDASGSLNIDEFLSGYDGNKEFADCLQTMNVTQSDIHMIFNICDEDGSGDVNYVEFVDQLRRIRRQGEQMLLYYVTEIRHKVQQLKLRLIDQVQAKLAELPDFGEEDPNSKLEIQLEGAPANPGVSEATEALITASQSLGSKPEEKQQKEQANPDMQLRATSFPEPKALSPKACNVQARTPATPVTPMLGATTPAVIVEEKDSPRFTREVMEEMVPVYGEGDPLHRLTTGYSASSNQVTYSSPPGNTVLGSEQLDRLMQINQDIAAVMQDVVSQSKVHTGLLKELTAEVPTLSRARQRDPSTPVPGRCCVPSSREAVQVM